jgi:hypothetical protein
MRGDVCGGRGFRAATGLNVQYHRLATSNAAEMGRRFAAALEDPKADPYWLSKLGNALATLANKIEPQPAAEIANGLAAALDKPQETDKARLAGLGNGLAALARKMDPQDAAEIARGLAATLQNPLETDVERVLFLSLPLEKLGEKMEPQDTAGIAKGLAAALENPQETDSDRLSNLSNAEVQGCRFRAQPAATLFQRPALGESWIKMPNAPKR